MEEIELKELWRNSLPKNDFHIKTNEMNAAFHGRKTTLDRNIQRRDKREIVASIIGIPGYTYLAYAIPYPITKLGCLMIVAWFFYIIYRFMNQSKFRREIDLTMSFLDQLKDQKLYMLHQEKLLKGIWSWYILPPVIANVLFIGGTGQPEDYEWEGVLANVFSFSTPSKVLGTMLLLAFCSYIYYVNRKAADQVYRREINQIDAIQAQVAKESKNLV